MRWHVAKMFALIESSEYWCNGHNVCCHINVAWVLGNQTHCEVSWHCETFLGTFPTDITKWKSQEHFAEYKKEWVLRKSPWMDAPRQNFWFVRKTLNSTAPHAVDRLSRKIYIYSLIWKLYSSFSWHHSQVDSRRAYSLGVDRHFIWEIMK